MSCLLPQFKCPPDTLSIYFKSHQHITTSLSKNRGPIYYRAQCSLSTTALPQSTITTAVIDMEKLQLQSFVARSNSVAAKRPWISPSSSTENTTVLDMEKLKLLSLEARSNTIEANGTWTYTDALGPMSQVNFRKTLATETLLTSEEAVIAAAAAEAVALAKAAMNVAKDAVMMVRQQNPNQTDSKPTGLSPQTGYSLYERARLAQLVEMEEASSLGKPEAAETIKESDDGELTNEELELLQAQLSKSVAVRSRRQTERRAKRARAAEKAAASVVSVKTGTTKRKKRAPLQAVDFSDPLRYLRGTTSTRKLLTPTEEQELSKGIQDLLKLEQLHEDLAKRCGAEPAFAQWAAAAGVDERTLRKRLNHGAQCKGKMITSNIRLVISIAKNYQGAGLNLQDLVQEGCRGLVRGAEKFDASKGFKFSTYAHWWIKQAVRKSLSDQSRTIRLPFHMVEATYRVKEAKKQLYSETGRHPCNEEIAKATGLSIKRIEAVSFVPKAPMSLDQYIGFNQSLKLSDIISDPNAQSSEDILNKKFMKYELEKVLDTLKPREKQVVKMRFGLVDGRPKTLQEIGEMMDVSRERIRQIESCAFRKLKNKRRNKHLKHYVIQ